MKLIILITVLSLPLCACGIKPKSVDAPKTVENDTFPRNYPTSE